MEDGWSTDEPRVDATREGEEPTTCPGTEKSLPSGRLLITDCGLWISEFLQVLANKRRRYALYYLRDQECSTLDDLSKQIAAQEHATSPEEVDEQAYKNVRINLYHAHLPKLEETGVIAYDRQSGQLCYRQLPEPMGELLDYCATLECRGTANG